MPPRLHVGIPLIGKTVGSSGLNYVKSFVMAAASLPENERPRLLLVVTDDTLENCPLYESVMPFFEGVVYCGQDLSAAKSLLGTTAIYCQCRSQFYRYLNCFINPRSSRKPLTQVPPLLCYPELAWYDNNPREIQQKYNLPDQFVYCFNPNWIQEGHLHLFQALSLLQQREQPVHLVYEGFTSNAKIPKNMRSFRHYLRKLKIDNLVHLLEPLPDMERIQLVRRSLFVIEPGTFEGLPVFAQQCQALGKTSIIAPSNCQPLQYMDLIAELVRNLEPGPEHAQEANTRSATLLQAQVYVRNFLAAPQSLHKRSGKKLRTWRNRQTTSNKHDIIIATSIVPHNLPNQKKAVYSWMNMGFRVIAFNSQFEAAIVQPHFPDVQFVVPPRDAASLYGKPYIYIDDILDYFAEQGSRICGIVNSDIYFRNGFLYNFVEKEAPNSFIYGARVEVSNLNEPAGSMNIWGYDYFFFDKCLLPYYPRENFCLGIPWWDLWMPLVALGQQLSVKEIITPHAHHLTHSYRYNLEILYDLSRTCAKYIPPPFPVTPESITRYKLFLRVLLKKYSTAIILPTV